MKVKATQTLTNYLKKNLAGYGFHFLKMGLEQYQRTVDSVKISKYKPRFYGIF